MISIVYCTYRPGGFDLLASGLAGQGEYELVVVDDYPGRDVTGYLLEKGVHLGYYGPSKPHCYPDQYRTAFFNACNTGLMRSKGDIVFFCQDYTWLPKGTIRHWAELFEEPKVVVVCGAVIKECRGPETLGDVTIWNGDVTRVIEDGRAVETWMPASFDVRCAGYSREYLLEANGFDERNDCHDSAYLTNIPWQISSLGYHIRVDRDWPLVMCRHDNWSSDRLWHASRTIPAGHDEMKWDTKKDVRSPNCFSLEKIREGE